MRKLLGLPLTLLGLLTAGSYVLAQKEDDFGVLKPLAPTPGSTAPSMRSVPAGIEPDRSPLAGEKRVENPYPISPEAGIWMICAATYLGEDGAELARQVATELREKHRFTSFIFNRGDEERRKQQEEFEALKKRYPGVPVKKRTYRVQDQYAVLLGGFKDFNEASAVLPKIKKLPPPTLKLEDGRNPYEVMTYQEIDPETKKQVTKTALVNPFHNAMVVRNPLAPTTQTNRPKWDPFWKHLNAHEEYSLLKNPKPWTLVVKEYMGARTLQQQQSTGSFLSALGLGGAKTGETLDAAAQQAHELARFLRQQKSLGLTSWVLHTRYSSVVCVGGFDSPEDPELQRTLRLIQHLRFNPANGGTDPIGLIPNPVPVEVPRP